MEGHQRFAIFSPRTPPFSSYGFMLARVFQNKFLEMHHIYIPLFLPVAASALSFPPPKFLPGTESQPQPSRQ
jgi:hypothetical protein